MSDEKSGGKWAAEVYDFLRIFRRINSTLYGLLLVEIGWVLLLIFVAKLTPTGGNTPQMAIITLPWPSFYEYRVVDLVLPGAIFLALAWVFWSGLIAYLWFSIRLIISHFLFWLFVLLGILAWVINIFMLWITVPIEVSKAKKYIKELSPEIKAEIQEKQTAHMVDFLNRHSGARENNWGNVANRIGWTYADLFYKEDKSEKEKNKLQKHIEHVALHKFAVDSVDFDRWIIVTRSWKALGAVLRSLRTQTYIGFAPIQSFNYEEDLMAAKAPAQAFSSAIDHMRMKLAQIKILRYLKFDILPDHIKPNNVSEAFLLRKIFGFDVLLWGSYIYGQPNKIWLNVDHDVKKPNEDDGFSNEAWKVDMVFPLSFKINYSKMIVDQTIFLDTYVALIVALIQSLKSRIGSENKRFLAQYIDDLRYGSADMDLVIEHLVFDVFPKLNLQKINEMPEDDFPSIPKIIVEIVGQWIGHVVSSAIIDRKRMDFIKENGSVLLSYLMNCIKAFPEISQNHYRAGFLSCLLGKPKDAVEFFENAKKHERISHEDTSSYVIGAASLFRMQFERELDEFYLAAYAALVARAINLGDAYTKTSEHENYKKMREVTTLLNLNMKTSVTVLDKLFSNEYKPGH